MYENCHCSFVYERLSLHRLQRNCFVGRKAFCGWVDGCLFPGPDPGWCAPHALLPTVSNALCLLCPFHPGCWPAEHPASTLVTSRLSLLIATGALRAPSMPAHPWPPLFLLPCSTQHAHPSDLPHFFLPTCRPPRSTQHSDIFVRVEEPRGRHGRTGFKAPLTRVVATPCYRCLRSVGCP